MIQEDVSIKKSGMRDVESWFLKRIQLNFSLGVFFRWVRIRLIRAIHLAKNPAKI
jgi:hypothetical protein